MTIAAELSDLTRSHGRLAPGFALGWRVAEYLREFFDGLDGVRVAAPAGTEQAAALRQVRTESRLPLDLVQTEIGRGWDALAYHPATGTVLEINAGLTCGRLTTRSGATPGAPHLPKDGDEEDQLRLARFLLDEPVEHCCRIVERLVVRSRHAGADGAAIPCRRCGGMTERRDIWNVNGIPCCANCTGLDPSWIALH